MFYRWLILCRMLGKLDQIHVVVPVWNDSARLSKFGPQLVRECAATGLPIRLVIADDGSDASEAPRLQELCRSFSAVWPGCSVHWVGKHRGKGGVLRDAWSYAQDASWLAFVDADGSTSAGDFIGLVQHALNQGCSVLGVRRRTADTVVRESWIRGLTHRGFLTIARLLLGLNASDPQCGAKVFKAEDYRKIEMDLQEDGLAFDCEILIRMQERGCRWIEMPVSWFEAKGGKVRLLRDAPRMLAALFRIRAGRRDSRQT